MANIPENGSNTHGDETRLKLIAAATTVFIEQGFRSARVQQIAESAGVRLSAINYHFGGKEGLYLAVLRHHGEQAIAQQPLFSDSQQTLQEQFRFMIHSLLLRMLPSAPAEPPQTIKPPPLPFQPMRVAERQSSGPRPPPAANR